MPDINVRFLITNDANYHSNELVLILEVKGSLMMNAENNDGQYNNGFMFLNVVATFSYSD